MWVAIVATISLMQEYKMDNRQRPYGIFSLNAIFGENEGI